MAYGQNLTYADLISADSSIDDLITALELLGQEYEGLTTQVKNAAREIRGMMPKNVVTTADKAALEAVIAEIEKLYTEYRKLQKQLTEVGKAEEFFAKKRAENSAEFAREHQELNAVQGSYNDLRATLTWLINEYKKLDATARGTQLGKDLVDEIRKTRRELNALDRVINQQETPHYDPTSLKGMEQELANLRREYKLYTDTQRQDPMVGGATLSQIQDLTQKLKEQTNAMKGQASTQDTLNAARKRYLDIMRDIDYTDPNRLTTQDRKTTEEAELNAYNRAIKEQLKMKRLEQEIALAAPNSYRQMSYTYELLALKIKNMNTQDEESIKLKEQLLQQARLLKQSLKEQEEALGDYHSSIGNYNVIWNGLQHETSQLIRELPAATISLNTFFLAISNNLPMFIDEIQNIKRKNKDLEDQGEETVSIIGQIAEAIFSWQTAVVLLITILTEYGDVIWDWIKSLWEGEKAIQSQEEALKEVRDEFLKNIDTYGKSIISLQKLSAEWKNLKSVHEKNQFIRDNEAEFRALDISVRDVNGAENVFAKNTDTVIKALQIRAYAAAMSAVAAEKYKEALKAQFEVEKELVDPSFWTKTKNWFKGMVSGYKEGYSLEEYAEQKKKGVPYAAAGQSFGSWKSRLTAIEEYEEAQRENAVKRGEADQLVRMLTKELERARELLGSVGIEEYHKEERRGGGRTPRDKEDEIYKRYLEIQKKYEASITTLERDEYTKRRKEAVDAAAAKIRALEEEYRKNEKLLAGTYKNQKKLTDEQRAMTEEAQDWIIKTIHNYNEELAHEFDVIGKDKRLFELGSLQEALKLRLEAIKQGSLEELELRSKMLLAQREAELIENSKLTKKEQLSEFDIIAKYNTALENLESEHKQKFLQIVNDNYNKQLTLVREGSAEELRIKMAQLDNEERLELEANKQLADGLRAEEELIRASYERRRQDLRGQYDLSAFDKQQEVEQAKFDAVRHSEYEITEFTLEQEKARWEYQIALAKAGALKWGEAEFAIAKANLDRINRELKENSIWTSIGKNGLFNGLLDALGFNEDAIDAINTVADGVVDAINVILEAEVKAAEAAVELAEERVSAAQSAYEAEVEARNNGYAHNVATAKKELDLEKKNQKDKQRILADAQRQQQALAAVSQATNLISASALIWSQLGFPWAIPAIATMWGSFAFAQVKARELANNAQEYGEGGLEFLEGGSHASGNDVPLGLANRRGKYMRAEGGEAVAVINKRQTKKYRKVLPNLIRSLNQGQFEKQFTRVENIVLPSLFEDRYAKAGEYVNQIRVEPARPANIDLTNLENSVEAIRANSEFQSYILPNGDRVIIKGNITRRISR